MLYASLWELWGQQDVLTWFCQRKMVLYTQVFYWMVLVLMPIYFITKILKWQKVKIYVFFKIIICSR